MCPLRCLLLFSIFSIHRRTRRHSNACRHASFCSFPRQACQAGISFVILRAETGRNGDTDRGGKRERGEGHCQEQAPTTAAGIFSTNMEIVGEVASEWARVNLLRMLAAAVGFVMVWPYVLEVVSWVRHVLDRTSAQERERAMALRALQERCVAVVEGNFLKLVMWPCRGFQPKLLFPLVLPP